MWSHREIQKLRSFKDSPYSSLIRDYAKSSTLLAFGSNPFFLSFLICCFLHLSLWFRYFVNRRVLVGNAVSGKKQVCQEQKENLCVNVMETVGKERRICRKRCEREETDFSRGTEKWCIECSGNSWTGKAYP